jgi:hypothetical protein
VRARTTARRFRAHKGILIYGASARDLTAWRSTRPSMRSTCKGGLMLRRGLRSGRPQIWAGPATFTSKNRHLTLFFLVQRVFPLLKPY